MTNSGRKPLLTIKQRRDIFAICQAKREEAARNGHTPRWRAYPTVDELARWNGVSRDTIVDISTQKRTYVRLSPLDEPEFNAA